MEKNNHPEDTPKLKRIYAFVLGFLALQILVYLYMSNLFTCLICD